MDVCVIFDLISQNAKCVLGVEFRFNRLVSKFDLLNGDWFGAVVRHSGSEAHTDSRADHALVGPEIKCAVCSAVLQGVNLFNS